LNFGVRFARSIQHVFAIMLPESFSVYAYAS
jgi:hypothetical protein